ncbi:MAG: tyrosine-type recombinase/integrase [Paracoccaceae bacterium]|nr:tyrosine-type recombinase/integrase [Paracoccaceae bacterium]
MRSPNRQFLTKRSVEALPAAARETVYWDRDLAGFGVRVYPSGTKVYMVHTRAKGKSRRVTIGRHGLWNAEDARSEAGRLIAEIKGGGAPVRPGADAASVNGPTIAQLAENYLTGHVVVHCKPATAQLVRLALEKYLLPEFGKLRLGEITPDRVASLHYRLHERPLMANHVVDLLSRLYNRAAASDDPPAAANPCRFIKKYPSKSRERFLTEQEFERLGAALDELAGSGRISASARTALRLLMLTGCRRSEILTLRWDDIDLEHDEIRLRDAKTGAREVPLSPAARELLVDLPRTPGNPWVIPGSLPGRHLVNLNAAWKVVCEKAKLHDVRVHDLRHSFASRALARGHGLTMIGRLLGHRQPQTTARYAHLSQHSVKSAAEQVANSIFADLGAAPDSSAAS